MMFGIVSLFGESMMMRVFLSWVTMVGLIELAICLLGAASFGFEGENVLMVLERSMFVFGIIILVLKFVDSVTVYEMVFLSLSMIDRCVVLGDSFFSSMSSGVRFLIVVVC